MPTTRKGFDPLASLFDLPEPAIPDVEEPPPLPPARGDALPDPPHVKPAPPAVPGVPPQVGPDPAQLAKILAKAAAARAGAPRPAPGGVTLVPESPTGTPTEAPRSNRASKPSSVASAPAPQARAAPPAPPAKAAAPAAKPATAAPASRLSAAPPPKRTLSAEDAMRAAAEEEARAKDLAAKEKAAKALVAAASSRAAAAPKPAPAAATPPSYSTSTVSALGDISDVVGGIIKDSLPELGALYVAKALVMDDRGVLTSLWRGHRARFCAAGDVAGAVAVTAVIRALASVHPGQLAVAHAVTDKTDWLVWVDLSACCTIAAFRDARAWFAPT